MQTYEDIITDFIKRKFGPTVGDMLIRDHLKRHRRTSFSEMSQEDQIEFSESLLRRIFGRFMDEEEVKVIILQLNLQFCTLIAMDKIKILLNKDTNIDPFTIKYESQDDAKQIIENLVKENLAFPIELSGDIKGQTYFFMNLDDSLYIAQLMLELLGQESLSDQMDEMKESAIKEFNNMLVPSVLDSVANTLKLKISFITPDTTTAKTKEEIMEVIRTMEKKRINKKIYTSELKFTIDRTTITINIFFLLDTSSQISEVLNMTDIEKDDSLSEVNLDNIKIDKTIAPDIGIIQLLKHFLENPEFAVESTIKSFGLNSVDGLTNEGKKKFIDKIILRYFNRRSDKVKEFIRKNAEEILRVI